MKIDGSENIKYIIDTYPKSLDVFISNGFKYKTKEEFIDAVGENTMLKTVLKVKGINTELFLYYLETAIIEEEQEKKYILEDYNDGEQLDFYGNTICPLKFTFKDALEELESEYFEKNGEKRKCYVEAGKNTNDSCGDLWSNPNLENFPGVVLSKEFNEYLGKDFREKTANKEYFTTNFYSDINLNSKLKDAGLIDTEGMYTVYATMFDVFLIDDNHLKKMDIPETREDLLNPMYKDNIILFGRDRSEMSNATFLYIYKEFGMEGIKKLANNVKHVMHGSQMAKTAGSKRKEGAGIYIVSGFFAKTCIMPNTRVVLPKDGCMTLPMYMLVRKDMLEKERDIVDYVLSDNFSDACVKAYTPHINSSATNSFIEKAEFEWLGWDFIREHDIPVLAKECEEVFLKEWKRLHPKGVLFL
ncbi:MAG: ABC transporter substrate-binding protein [Lachnospirales bacterium]